MQARQKNCVHSDVHPGASSGQPFARLGTVGEWAKVFAGFDTCVTPALSMTEAVDNEHLAGRGAFVDVDGVAHAAPAPRLSRTMLHTPSPPPKQFTEPMRVLEDWHA